MKLFVKKKEKSNSTPCCTDHVIEKAVNAACVNTAAEIKVLGSGCAKCNSLEASVLEALRALGMDTKIVHVTDFAEIASYGVMTTPALVVNGKVVSYGKTLKKDEVIAILKKFTYE